MLPKPSAAAREFRPYIDGWKTNGRQQPRPLSGEPLDIVDTIWAISFDFFMLARHDGEVPRIGVVVTSKECKASLVTRKKLADAQALYQIGSKKKETYEKIKHQMAGCRML